MYTYILLILLFITPRRKYGVEIAASASAEKHKTTHIGKVIEEEVKEEQNSLLLLLLLVLQYFGEERMS